MIARTAEYDAFGPWIFEIDDQQTMPPLFVKYYKQDEEPLMLIKIPRKIDRKDATPDMHLYDYVIAALSTHLYILKRVKNSVEERRLPYRDIVAVKNTTALLQGKLTLYIPDETLTVEYNTVSEEIMIRLVNIIREKYKTQEKVLFINPIEYNNKTIEYHYAGIINQFKEWDSRIRLLAYQPQSMLTKQYKFLNEKIIPMQPRKKFMSSTAFVTNDAELIVLQREKQIRLIRQGDLSCSILFLPYVSMKKISRTQDGTQNALGLLNISTDACIFSFLYTDNGRQVKELYRALKDKINGLF